MISVSRTTQASHGVISQLGGAWFPGVELIPSVGTRVVLGWGSPFRANSPMHGLLAIKTARGTVTTVCCFGGRDEQSPDRPL